MMVRRAAGWIGEGLWARGLAIDWPTRLRLRELSKKTGCERLAIAGWRVAGTRMRPGKPGGGA